MLDLPPASATAHDGSRGLRAGPGTRRGANASVAMLIGLPGGMILRADVSRRSGLASPRPGDGVLASWHPTAARSFADVAP